MPFNMFNVAPVIVRKQIPNFRNFIGCFNPKITFDGVVLGIET